MRRYKAYSFGTLILGLVAHDAVANPACLNYSPFDRCIRQSLGEKPRNDSDKSKIDLRHSCAAQTDCRLT